MAKKELLTKSEKNKKLAAGVSLEPRFEKLEDIRIVVGCDVWYSKDGHMAIAAAVACELPKLTIIRKKTIIHKDLKRFPYEPGLFAFREGPPLQALLEEFDVPVDVIVFDGHGIAHPQRCGLASHLGVLMKISTIGCAKTPLYGEFEEPPPGVRGAFTMIRDLGGDYLGIVLRTKPYVKPVFVSPGHLMDIPLAGDIILACTKKFRIPEPLRLAHHEATKRQSTVH